MAFILSEQRENDDCFENYEAYLAEHAKDFPPHAHALATSDWYYTFLEKAPHDARLVTLKIGEGGSFEASLVPKITIRLLDARDQGFIEFEYPEVYAYNLSFTGGSSGHLDWRYDEFRITESGHVLHEIEWWGPIETGRWLIEASDVVYSWSPK
jgi:hypothetical protein